MVVAEGAVVGAEPDHPGAVDVEGADPFVDVLGYPAHDSFRLGVDYAHSGAVGSRVEQVIGFVVGQADYAGGFYGGIVAEGPDAG